MDSYKGILYFLDHLLVFILLKLEECRAMGHMPLMNQIRGDICVSSVYEILNIMFLPRMKKALIGGIGGRRQN
jgi:hypothetical protein